MSGELYNEHRVIEYLLDTEYKHTDFTREELFQAAYLGYLKARQNYNEAYGENMSLTYAQAYMRNEINKLLKNHATYKNKTTSYEPWMDTLLVDDRDVDSYEPIELIVNHYYEMYKHLLTHREDKILYWSYLADTTLTGKDIARRLSISPQYVSRIKLQAIDKLKKAIENE